MRAILKIAGLAALLETIAMPILFLINLIDLEITQRGMLYGTFAWFLFAALDWWVTASRSQDDETAAPSSDQTDTGTAST